MPLAQKSGNITADAYGGGSTAANYIEDVFSTYLYTGNGSTQSIVNGIDLAGKGGLTWIKYRGAYVHVLTDTARGVSTYLDTSATGGNGYTTPYGLTSFNSNGFSLKDDSPGNYGVNGNGSNYVSWTFRKQPKFFDVVTWTSNGTNQTISHSLGSVPGCIIIKDISNVDNWWVYHRSAANALQLNTTSAMLSYTAVDGVTSTSFNALNNGLGVNGHQYVAYLFAHNAGGFGLTGTDNVISCGSFTMPSSGDATITLGYEPQWVMAKTSSTTGGWFMADVMRGWSNTSDAYVYANTSGAEVTNTPNYWNPTATGFVAKSGCFPANSTVIYIAIRRGPMKVPTDATKVFKPTFVSSSGTFTSTSNFPIDLIFYGSKSATDKWYWFDRLRGTGVLDSSSTAAESGPYPTNFASNVNFQQTGITGDFSSYISYDLQRAPSFFDEVCYTGAYPSNVTVNHNLGVTPEFIITKARSTAGYDWRCYHSALGIGTTIRLNLTNAAVAGTQYVSVSSTNFVVGNSGDTDNNGTTYVSYLFATCAGVSKVGSYTGNGTTQTINCGFAGGARMVLIKRTDSTGNWEIFDTARGMVSGTDPHLELNTTNAETNANWVYTITSGFQVVTSDANVNASGGQYLYLAVA